MKLLLKLLTKSFYDAGRRIRCSVPAPPVRFSVGGRMVIARQSWGKGSDYRGRNAAGPGESIASAHRVAAGFSPPIGGLKAAATHFVGSAEEAVRGADIIVTATSSKEPVVKREWLAPGTHINAVGSSVKTSRELDAETVAGAAFFVDRRESTVNESGDYLMSGVGPDHIRAEIGEILIGQAKGRRSKDEITIFKSLGLAIEDLASAQFLFSEAQRRGRGAWVDF